MSFDLSQLDQNVRYEDRLWNLNLLLPKNHRVELGNRDVYMLVLPKDSLGGSARAFDMIDRTQSQSGLRSALLQFVLRTLELIIDDHGKSAKEGKERLPYPLEVFLETVVESEQSQRAHADSGTEVNFREAIIRHKYPNATKPTRFGMARRPTESESSLLNGCESREVLEYRLWIVVNEHVNFPLKLEAVMKLAMNEHAKRTSATTLAFDNQSLREFRKATGTDPSTTDFSISKILKADEHWAVINSPNAMLDAIAIYTNNREFLNTAVRSQALSAAQPLSDNRNPAFLGSIFMAAQQFHLCDIRADPSQNLWRNYVSKEGEGGRDRRYMHFPHPDRTLIVPADCHGRKLTARYLPDYQLFNAQQRLLHEDLQRAQQYIANAPSISVEERESAETVRIAAAKTGFMTDMNDELTRDGFEDEADSDEEQLAGGVGSRLDRETRMARERIQAASKKANLSVDEQNMLDIDAELTDRHITGRLKRFNGTETRGERDAIDALVLQSRYVDPAVHSLQMALEQARSGHINVTTMHMLAKYFHEQYAAISQVKSPQERAMLHTEMQKSVLRDYVTSCTSPLADVSAVGRTINAFMHDATMKHQNYFEPMLFFDPDLSVFGHMMVREMTLMDQLYHTHSVHRLQLAMQVSLCDAYRHSHTLHFNTFATGPPEMGKSRALEHVESRSIPGTVLVCARRTDKSSSLEGSDNDVTECYHEAPANWLRDPSQQKSSNGRDAASQNKDSEAHEMFKAKLTSMIVRTPDTRRKADGTFYQGLRISEQIMSYIMCTNLFKYMIALAILSRLYHEETAEFRRKDATIGDKSLDEQNESRETKVLRERANWEFRLTQTLFYHVEKLIFTKGLTAPTLTTFMIFSPIFVRVMEEEFSIRVSIRSLIKMEIFIRHLVIRRALFMLYAAPTAPFLQRNVSVKHLINIDPWLYDDAEIVFFAFRFMRSQYVDEHVAVVARALRTYITKRADSPRLFERYRLGSAPVKQKGGSRVPNGAVPAMDKYVSAEQLERRNALNNETWQTVKSDDQTFDFSRILIRQRPDSLAVELETIMARNGETLRLKREQIERCLASLAQQTVHDYPYLPNAAFGGVVTDLDFPVRADTTQQKDSSIAVVMDHSRSIVSIHVSVLQQLRKDPVEAVIAACCDSNMPQKKMLSGALHQTDLPHMFGVFTPIANERILHYVTNRSGCAPSALCMIGKDVDEQRVASEDEVDRVARDRMAEHAKSGTILRGMSVDEYSARRRMEELNMPAEASASFSFQHIHDQIKRDPKNYVRPESQMKYPDEQRIKESQTSYVKDVKTIIANLSREDAATYLDGNVSFLLNAGRTAAERDEIAGYMKVVGYDPSVGKELLARWEADRLAQEKKCREVQTELREEAKRTGAKMLQREDELRAEKLKKAAARKPKSAYDEDLEARLAY